MDRESHMEENIKTLDENMVVDTPALEVIQVFQNIRRNMNNWQCQRIKAVVQLLCYIVHLVHLLDIQAMIVSKAPRNLDSKTHIARQKLMDRLTGNEINCRNMLRMGPYAFALLCQKLRGTGFLKDYRHATIEEQVAKFLYVLGQNFHN